MSATMSATIAAAKNVFSGRPETDFKVEVTFNDGTPSATWSQGRHPAGLPGADQRVTEAALRKSFLDFRALLDTDPHTTGSREPPGSPSVAHIRPELRRHELQHHFGHPA